MRITFFKCWAVLALAVGIAGAQQINPNQIRPSSTNGYVLCTVDGTTQWALCGSTLPSGTTNQLLYYPSSGTTVAPLTLGTNLSITSGTLNAAGGGSGSLPTATAAGQAPIATGAGTTYVAGQIAPVGGSYTFYVSGSTYYARNNNTMAVDYSGADAGVVINAAINNVASVCGHLYFQPGIYNINSLVQETQSGFTQVYYGIRIPAIAASGQYCQWFVQGDSNTPLIDAFGSGVQTGGVIFNVTATAVASVPGASTADIIGVWQQPPASAGAAASDYLRNFDVRFPTNQRGSETGVDMTQALSVHYYNVVADTAVAQASLAFPVAGTYGMYGLTTTLSVHEENTMELAYAIGYDHALDIESEHTVLIHSYGINCNYAIDYGVRGTSIIYHNSVFIDSGWGECAHGLTLGANLLNGSMLDITGLDAESATAGIWAPVYHGKEVNPGYTSGIISYSNVLSGGGYPSTTLFDGGGGTEFVIEANNVLRTNTQVATTYNAVSSSGNYAGINFDNAAAGSFTSSYELGSGYIGETADGVATKWFIFDNVAGKMRMAGDASGNVNIGYTTPYPTTFPALFSVGTAGQFQVDAAGDMTGAQVMATADTGYVPGSTAVLYSSGFGELAATGPTASSVPDLYLAGRSSNASLSDFYLHCVYNTSCSFDDPVGLAATTAATSSTAVSSPGLSWTGHYWNGTVSTNDTWTCTNTFNTAAGFTNPPSVLTCTHSGSSGGGTFQVGNLLATNINAPTIGIYSGNLNLDTASTATSGANYPSSTLNWQDSYWTGSTFANSGYALQLVDGAGTNPTQTLLLTRGNPGTGTQLIDLSAEPIKLNTVTAPTFNGTGTATLALGTSSVVGTGATAVCATSQVCDSYSGTVDLTTGTGSLASGIALVVTFPVTRTNRPNCVITAYANASTPLQMYAESFTSVSVGPISGLTASTAYLIVYVCGGS